MLISSKKKIIIKVLLIFFIIFNLLPIKALAIVSPKTEFYVNDYANLLSEETKEYIINTNVSLHSQTGAQIVVVTVENLEGNSLEDYATELFRSFGIGDKSKNNGVLLLLALEEREFRVEVGYGLEGILPDGKTGRIQDKYIIPYLKENNWNDGIKNGFSAIVKIVAEEYGVEVNAQEAIAGESSDVFDDYFNTFMIFPVLSGIIGSSMYGVKKKWKIFSIVLFGIVAEFLNIVILRNIFASTMMTLFCLIIFVISCFSNRRTRGGWYIRWRSRRIIRRFFRWWLLRRRRFFWRRRKLKKFLIINFF